MKPWEDLIRVLYEYGEHGVRDLREFFSYKYLDRWLPEVIAMGLVDVKEVIGKGGRKKVHFLTSKGVTYAELHVTKLRICDNLDKFIEPYTPEQKLQILGRLFGDMFEYASSLFLSGKNVDMMRVFRDAIQLPVKAFLNKQILDDKEYIIKTLEGHGEFPPDLYCDILFIQRQFSLPFIIRDADLAWNLNHYLNSHHVYILTLLGIHSKEEIEQKNKVWLEKNRDAIEPHSVWQKKALKELERRKEALREIMNVPKDYGKTSITFYNDIT